MSFLPFFLSLSLFPSSPSILQALPSSQIATEISRSIFFPPLFSPSSLSHKKVQKTSLLLSSLLQTFHFLARQVWGEEKKKFSIMFGHDGRQEKKGEEVGFHLDIRQSTKDLLPILQAPLSLSINQLRKKSRPNPTDPFTI